MAKAKTSLEEELGLTPEKEQRPNPNEEVLSVNDVVRLTRSEVMDELAPAMREVRSVREEVDELKKLKTEVATLKDAIEHAPAPEAPKLNPEEIKAIVTPLIQAEVQNTFRGVMMRFGVKEETIASGDTNRILGELIPAVMPAVMGTGLLGAKKQQQQTVELKSETPAPATPATSTKHTLTDKERIAYQQRCQYCGGPLKIRGSVNECPKCGKENYAFRCGHCKEVFLTPMDKTTVVGTHCPLCDKIIELR